MDALRDENSRLKSMITSNNCKIDQNTYDTLLLSKKLNETKASNENNKQERNDESLNRVIKRIDDCKSINHEILAQNFSNDNDGKRLLITIYHGNACEFEAILQVSHLFTLSTIEKN